MKFWANFKHPNSRYPCKHRKPYPKGQFWGSQRPISRDSNVQLSSNFSHSCMASLLAIVLFCNTQIDMLCNKHWFSLIMVRAQPVKNPFAWSADTAWRWLHNNGSTWNHTIMSLQLPMTMCSMLVLIWCFAWIGFGPLHDYILFGIGIIT